MTASTQASLAGSLRRVYAGRGTIPTNVSDRAPERGEGEDLGKFSARLRSWQDARMQRRALMKPGLGEE